MNETIFTAGAIVGAVAILLLQLFVGIVSRTWFPVERFGIELADIAERLQRARARGDADGWPVVEHFPTPHSWIDPDGAVESIYSGRIEKTGLLVVRSVRLDQDVAHVALEIGKSNLKRRDVFFSQGCERRPYAIVDPDTGEVRRDLHISDAAYRAGRDARKCIITQIHVPRAQAARFIIGEQVDLTGWLLLTDMRAVGDGGGLLSGTFTNRDFRDAVRTNTCLSLLPPDTPHAPMQGAIPLVYSGSPQKTENKAR